MDQTIMIENHYMKFFMESSTRKCIACLITSLPLRMLFRMGKSHLHARCLIFFSLFFYHYSRTPYLSSLRWMKWFLKFVFILNVLSFFHLFPECSPLGYKLN